MSEQVIKIGVEVFRNRWGAAFVAWRKVGIASVFVIAGKECVLQDYQVGVAFCNPMDLPRTGWSRREWRAKGEEMAVGRMVKRKVILRTEPSTLVRRFLLMALVEPVLTRPELTHGELAEMTWRRWGCKLYGQGSGGGDFHEWLGRFLGILYRTEVRNQAESQATKEMQFLLKASRDNPVRVNEEPNEEEQPNGT